MSSGTHERCADCVVFADCPIRDLASSGHQDYVSAGTRVFEKGEHVFRSGDPADCVVFLKSGALKAYALTSVGEEQVVAFHFPGDLVGLESMEIPRQVLCVEALSLCRVCTLPCEELTDLCSRSRPALRRLLEQASRRLRCNASMLALVGHRSAEQRVTAFLLELARRLADRGDPCLVFDLKMTRADIASYLALAVETVSRVMTRLQENGVIEVEKNRRVYVLDADAMEAVVEGPSTGATLCSGAGLRGDSGDVRRPLDASEASLRRTAAGS